MNDLRIETAGPDLLEDWRLIHNAIIPTAPLSPGGVRERATRNRLDVAYADGVAVGCSTVRPPDEDTPAATVIARVLPEYRGRGYGTALYEHGLAHARTLSDEGVETVVLASNTEGLRFALSHGFVETERYVLPGDTVPFVTLRLDEEGRAPAA
ncbi:GNAT family N-acetyltransferase [Streptomyces sp. NPDC020422]|uniref:GNAT family N-acetyltransferase n=1 Tax=Streptomyces sp. NPDC020422 TaxID=3365074 RepID=UPI00379F9725